MRCFNCKYWYPIVIDGWIETSAGFCKNTTVNRYIGNKKKGWISFYMAFGCRFHKKKIRRNKMSIEKSQKNISDNLNKCVEQIKEIYKLILQITREYKREDKLRDEREIKKWQS